MDYKNMIPAPGYCLIRRVGSDKMDVEDFMNQHLEKATWAEVIRVGEGKRPVVKAIGHFALQHKRLWFEFSEAKGIKPGDIVAFNYVYNSGGRSSVDATLPDDYMIVPFHQILAKNDGGKISGIGEWVALKMDISQHKMAGAEFDRDNTSVWNTGTVVGGLGDGCQAVTFPCMAMPLQYAHRGFKAADGIWVVEKKYIFGYGRS